MNLGLEVGCRFFTFDLYRPFVITDFCGPCCVLARELSISVIECVCVCVFLGFRASFLKPCCTVQTLRFALN